MFPSKNLKTTFSAIRERGDVMKKKYVYKNIVTYQSGNSWVADYCDGNNRFALHRTPCRTKRLAYSMAVCEVDWLNFKLNFKNQNHEGK